VLQGLGGADLESQLSALEQSLQPAKDLRMGKGQLLERTVANLRRQIVQLVIELGGKGFLQLGRYLAVEPAQVVDRSGFGTDATSLLQSFSGNPSDPEEALRVQDLSGY
jgi:hypothetical protein